MNLNVGLVFGGRSVEHEVSVISAIQTYEAMNSERYKVTPLYISKMGDFYTGIELLSIDNYKNIGSLLSRCSKVHITNDGGRAMVLSYPPRFLRNNLISHIDVAFPVVHGTSVEDGILQGYLETLRIPYVGPDVLSSAICMDKAVAKRLLQSYGIPVVKWIDINSRTWYDAPDDALREIATELGDNVVVKPCNLGSSIGVTKASGQNEIRIAIDDAFIYTDHVMIETAITNLKEINCAVMGDSDSSETSACEEPILCDVDSVLSFTDKYLAGNGTKGMKGAGRQIPANLDPETEELIRSLATSAFHCLGCAGVARIDFLIDTYANQIYVNEVNTIPGSLSSYLWEANGITFEQLVDRLIQLALKRERNRGKITFTLDMNLFALRGAKGKLQSK